MLLPKGGQFALGAVRRLKTHHTYRNWLAKMYASC